MKAFILFVFSATDFFITSVFASRAWNFLCHSEFQEMWLHVAAALALAVIGIQTLNDAVQKWSVR